MATKAELEAELAGLKSELAQMRDARAREVETGVAEKTAETDGDDSGLEKAPAFDEAQIKELVADLEDVASKHPAVMLVGVFVAGLLIGRLLSR